MDRTVVRRALSILRRGRLPKGGLVIAGVVALGLVALVPQGLVRGDVTAGSATHLVVGLSDPNPTAGDDDTFTVVAETVGNAVATDYLGTVQFTSSDPQAVLPSTYTFTVLDAGSHQFTVTLKTAGSQTVSAGDIVNGFGPVPAAADVSPGQATDFAITGFPPSTTAGVGHALTVTALDQFGNTASGYTGTVHLTSTDGAAVFGADDTLTSGVGSFSATLKTAGSQTITATDTVSVSIIGSLTGITVDPAATSTLLVSGYPGSTTAGVAHLVTVTAHDAFGNVTTAYAGTVHLASDDLAASSDPDATMTAGTGSFNVTLKTAGTRAITATDTADGTVTGSQTGITVDPAGAASLELTGPASVVAGAPATDTVTARDVYGNVATGYSGTVTFSTSDPSPTLPADHTFTGADAGVGSFSVTLTTAGAQTVTVNDTVTPSLTDILAVAVGPGAADHFLVAGYLSPTVAGVSHPLTVTAVDAAGNTATGYTGTVQLTSSDVAAVLGADATLTSGVGSFSATLKIAGPQSITATDTVDTSITGVQAGITVDPADATSLAVGGFGPTVNAGVPDLVTVTAHDDFGNVATGYTGTVSITSSDGQAALPPAHAFTGGDAGTHQFSATLKTAGSQSITATDGLLSGTQNSITVDPAGAASLVLTGPGAVAASAPATYTVTALDAFGNTATGYAGTITFSSSDPAAVLPSNDTLAAGTRDFSATLKTAGTRSITVTDTADGTLTDTLLVTVGPGAAKHFVVIGYTSPTIAGVSHVLTVTAMDPDGNTATGYTGTIQLTSSDPSATLPGNYRFTGADSGAHTFSVTLKTAGAQSITATDTVDTSITGSQTGITVGPASASTLVVSGYPGSTMAGVAHLVAVTAHDAFGNVATGYGGTVHLTSSDPAAVHDPDAMLVAGTANFSVTLKTAGTRSITATDTVDTSITGSQTGITVDPATVASLELTGPASVLAGAPTTYTVTARDAYGNVATDYAGTVHFSSSDGAAVLPADDTLALGMRDFSVTLKAAGAQTVTVTDTVTASLTDALPVTVGAGAADHLVVSGFPDPTAVGAAHTVTVSARDADGNLATGYRGTVQLTSSDGAATLPGPYTFTAGDGGTHALTVTLNMAGTRSITATDTVDTSITGSQSGITVDTPPTAAADAYAVLENATLTVASRATGVLGNDTDADPGDTASLTATLTSSPSHGLLALDADGTFTYTPTAAYHGPDTFQYQAVDPVGFTSSIATVTIRVDAPPVALTDAYTTKENGFVASNLTTTATTGVLHNDTDADGDVLTAAKAADPLHGTVTLDADGSFVYTPGATYNGTDQFTYTVSDGFATSPAATVMITITAVNQPPTFSLTASPDVTVVEDANDATAFSRAAEAGGFSAGPSNESSQTLLGFVVTNDDAALFAQPPAISSAGTLTFRTAVNANGAATVTVRAQDSGGTANGGADTSAAQTFSITVTAVNDAPTVNVDVESVGQSSTVNTFDVLANDFAGPPDEQAGGANAQTLTIAGVTQPAHGHVTGIGGTVIDYAPTPGFICPASQPTNCDTFTYTVTDNGSPVLTSAPGTVFVTITATTSRLAGADRYATSVQIVSANYGSNLPVVYVATGTGFADGLTGAAAAARFGAPLVLINGQAATVPANIDTELKRLVGPSTQIRVLGGPSSVSANLYTRLGAYTTKVDGQPDIIRLSGPDRYQTAVEVSANTYPAAPASRSVFIASGLAFPDALSAAGVAGHLGAPLILVPGTRPDLTSVPTVVAELRRLTPLRIYVAGSTAAVSQGISNTLHTMFPTATIQRFAGANRYQTSTLINDYFFTSPAFAGFGPTPVSTVYVASGVNFPDALSGAALAGMKGAPLVLVPGTSSTISGVVVAGRPVIRDEFVRLLPHSIVVFGSSGAVSTAIFNQLAGLPRSE